MSTEPMHAPGSWRRWTAPTTAPSDPQWPFPLLFWVDDERSRHLHGGSEPLWLLALEIQRYLADEAVSAAPPSTGYLLRKFLRKHRGPSPTPATPPTSTPPVTAPLTLTDSATLAGGYHPTGSVTLYLFAPGVTPNGTDSNNVYSDTVTVSGNGSYSTSAGNHPGGYTPTTTGAYQWVAVYGGDPQNNGVASNYGSASEAVTSSLTISGFQYLDTTGNGFGSSNAALANVTINLYKESNGSSGLQTGSSGDILAASTTTGSNGAYSFTNLVLGTYYVQAVVPSGYIQTGGGAGGSDRKGSGVVFTEEESCNDSRFLFHDYNDSRPLFPDEK